MSKVIAICGKICSGKTYYAEQLKKTENAIILSRDEATYYLINNEQNDFYDIFINRLDNYLLKKAVEIVNVGCNVILDWGFWTKNKRNYTTTFLKKNNIDIEWHYVDVSPSTWENQIKKRNKKIAIGDGGYNFYVDEKLLNKMNSRFEKPSKLEIDVWHINYGK